jgi:hypothetical protein
MGRSNYSIKILDKENSINKIKLLLDTIRIEKKGLVEKPANFIIYLETRKIIHKSELKKYNI